MISILVHSYRRLLCTHKQEIVLIQTRGESNLAKTASNALHTLQALDSITIAVPKIRKRLQKSIVGHVIQTRICMTYCCTVFVRAPPTIYRHTKFQFCGFRSSGDKTGIPKFRIRSRDPAPTPSVGSGA